MKPNKPIQIVLASGSKLLLEGICKILNEKYSIKTVAEALNREEIEKYTTEIKPEFLFLDNRTLEIDIHKLLNLISKKSPNTKVILLSNQTEEEPTFPNIIRITKETDSSELIQIIGGESLNKGASAKEVTSENSTEDKLTKMEMKIVELITGGFSNKEIARRLSISEKTVKAHLTNIFVKLGLQNRYQLIVYAKQLKIK